MQLLQNQIKFKEKEDEKLQYCCVPSNVHNVEVRNLYNC